MKNQLIISSMLAGLLMFSSSSYGRSGWYAGVDLGVGFASDADTAGSATDSPTNCDQALADDVRKLDANTPECENNHSTWSNEAEFDTGVLVGANVGYVWDNIRLEGEYNYRQNSGSDYHDITFPGAKAPEFSSAVELFDDLEGHHFFVNLYYDFNQGSSPWTPYIGGGVGVALMSMDYSNQFIRKSQPDFSTDNPMVNANAAGTASLVNKQSLEDALFGYQFLAGIDYQLTENVFIGTKFRYAIFEDFADDGKFDLLRSHAPLRNDGSPLGYSVDGDDIDFWSISLNLKYFF